MKPEQVKVEDGKASKTNIILIKEIDFLDSEYSPQLFSDNEIAPTGQLLICKLSPKNACDPEFVFRWDEQKDTMDIDIRQVTKKMEQEFKEDKNGFSGHHPKRLIKTDGRFFEICLKVPQKVVFKGTVEVTLHRKLNPALRKKI